jgi:hypothetical protein
MTRNHQRAAAVLVAAFAVAAPCVSAQSASGPKWEVEFHGGFAAATTPDGGAAAALPVGEVFTTLAGSQSRRQATWLFGDGTALLNFVNNTLAPTAKITPLDPVIGSAAGSRGSGGAVGVRLARRLGSRYFAEFGIDYARTPLEFSQQARDGIEASRTSFINAFRSLFLSGPSSNPTVTATSTFSDGSGSELLTTGVFGIDLMTSGRLIPYVVGGAGVAHSLGDAPTATLVGNYGFVVFAPAGINETDSVTVRLAAPSHSAVGVFGGGVRYNVSPRWGIRGDVRFFAGGGSNDVEVDARPTVVTGSPGVILITPINPSAVFSSTPAVRSSLSASAISGLQTFAGSGSAIRTNVAAGVYLRF